MNSADCKKKVGVLFIVPSLRRAGAETQLVDLANGLDATRFDKSLVVFERNIDQLGRLNQDEVEFHHCLRTGKYNFLFVRNIAALIDKKEIDVIHCTLQISLLVGWLAARLARRKPKLVVAIHTTVNVTRRSEYFDQLLYRRLLNRCERVIFVCHAQAEYWKGKYPSLADHATVIYNGVDSQYFSREPFEARGAELRRAQAVPADAVVIACIAGFRPEKGHRYLIDAFSRLEGEPYLFLAGDGPLRTEIGDYVKLMNLVDRVRFLGEVTDVRPVLAATDVSVLASTEVETFSMAMLESMAMEVPVVVTDIGGLKEAIVPGETGGLVKPAAPAELADVLRRSIGDPDEIRAKGIRARERVRALFSREAMTRATAQLLDEVARTSAS